MCLSYTLHSGGRGGREERGYEGGREGESEGMMDGGRGSEGVRE